MGQNGHVAGVVRREKYSTFGLEFNICSGNEKTRRSFGIRRNRWKNNIKMNLTERQFK